MSVELADRHRAVDTDDGTRLDVVRTAAGAPWAVFTGGVDRLEFPLIVARCPTPYRTCHGMISPMVLIPAYEVNYALANHLRRSSDFARNTRMVEKIIKMIAVVNKASPLAVCDGYFWSDFSELKKRGAIFLYRMPPNEVLIDLSIRG